MGNGFNEWGIGMIEVSKVNSGSLVKGFRIANSRKMFDINLAKISVYSPRLFISKNCCISSGKVVPAAVI